MLAGTYEFRVWTVRSGLLWTVAGAQGALHWRGQGVALGVLEVNISENCDGRGCADFLAALHFHRRGKEKTGCAVAVLGAANACTGPEALAKFAGKLICLYPHADEAGRKRRGLGVGVA